ncbi:uncharacterized protein [Rutidosis leptorrhynchoides]|uniref:uncharacterized protein n=1 Tax=Rutidosis leptorrhynchoides TaxID=125765 RepID=UPI003A9946F3
MEKQKSTEDEIRPHEEEEDDDDDDDDMFSDYSSYMSPVRLSNSDNSQNLNAGDIDIHKVIGVNDITGNDNATDFDMGDGKGNMSADNSSYSSPVSVSNFEHPINTHVVLPDIQKEDHERVEHNSTYNSSYSSPDAHVGEPTLQKEDQDKGNSVIDAKFDFVANDIEINGQEKHNSTNNSSYSSPERFSTSENSASIHAGEPAYQNEDVDSINDTETDIKLRGHEERNSAYNSYASPDRLSNSENSVNIHAGEPDIHEHHQENVDSVNDTNFNFTDNENSMNIHGGEPDQKEDQEHVDLINDTKDKSTATDMELAGQEEHNSVRFSTSENSINTRALEPAIQKEDNSVIDTKDDSVITDVDIRDQEADNSTDNFSIKLSDSEKLINDSIVDPDIDQENDISLNDVTPKSVATDNEIRMQEEDNLVSNSFSPVPLLDSEKLTESNVQNVNQDENNFVNDTNPDCISKDGEKLGNVEDEVDTKQSCEMIEDGHQTKEDGETSLSEEKKDEKYDPEDDTSKKESSLVLYGTRDLNLAVWQPKSSVFTKFAKLYSVSNMFRRLAGKNNKRIDSNEKNEEVNSSERDNEEVKRKLLDKPSLREIRTLSEKNQEDEVVLESPEIKAIKGRIILYTKLWCKDCKEVRIFLRKRSIRYSEINIDVYPSRKSELEEITGSSNVPKVFFNQELIGGLNELKELDESGQLEEKIECVMCEMPSSKAPLPPFSGEDDVSSRGVIDELAIIVKKMKESIVVKDRFYKFRRVTNCFLGSDAVDFLLEDQVLQREEAIEFGRKLEKELFFRHVLEENIFEDGKHLYRFLDHDPIISQCQNIPRGIIQLKRQPLVELSNRLRFLLYAILDAYTSEDGKHVAYRTIHGSEEFARYLRIVEELQRVDLNRIAKEERLAFFINLYNLMAIHAILVRGHPEGALDRRKLFNDFKYVIGGRAYSLSDIYNGILRSNQRPPYTLTRPFGISDKRFKVSLPYPEPLIHFALVSGNRSSPALRCYSPKNIDRELMDAARDFLQGGAFILDMDSMTISVTKILKWYSVDFGKNEVEVLKHAANYLEVEKTQTLLELLHSTQLKVVYKRYDWRLNS